MDDNVVRKLDLLQEMAIKRANCPHVRYLIDLLAEHAEEDETDDVLLRWAGNILG